MKKLCRTKPFVSPGTFHSLDCSLIEQSKRSGLKGATESTAGIIPGDRGMVGDNWCRPPLRMAEAAREAYITSSSGRSRVRSVHPRKRSGAARRDQKPRRAESGPRDVSTRAPTQLPQRVSVATAQTRTQSQFLAGRPRQKARFAARTRRVTELRPRGESEPRQSSSTSSDGAVPQNGITPLQTRNAT